ncbi:hypothetical protein QIG23_28300, partial [Klebsiella pneumoniae]|nr:hypothetical protein [Klebsiella pneumoniae]
SALTLHNVPTAPGTTRLHGFPPLTEWLCAKAAWAGSALENPRAKDGCTSDTKIPTMHRSASKAIGRLVVP